MKKREREQAATPLKRISKCADMTQSTAPPRSLLASLQHQATAGSECTAHGIGKRLYLDVMAVYAAGLGCMQSSQHSKGGSPNSHVLQNGVWLLAKGHAKVSVCQAPARISRTALEGLTCGRCKVCLFAGHLALDAHHKSGSSCRTACITVFCQRCSLMMEASTMFRPL